MAGRDASGRGAFDPDRILDLALDLAEEVGFDQRRSSAVAERARVSPAEVARRFPDADAAAYACFARGSAAIWATPDAELDHLDPAVRPERVMLPRLDALAPRRALTGRMLAAKLWPSHPHHRVPMVFDLSRRVHAFLDMARLPGKGPERAAQEIGATALLLGTLALWLVDPSPGQQATRSALRRDLAVGVGLLRMLGARGRARP